MYLHTCLTVMYFNKSGKLWDQSHRTLSVPLSALCLPESSEERRLRWRAVAFTGQYELTCSGLSSLWICYGCLFVAKLLYPSSWSLEIGPGGEKQGFPKGRLWGVLSSRDRTGPWADKELMWWEGAGL